MERQNENIKPYDFYQLTQMQPGSIIEGFVETDDGVKLGNAWSIDGVWKRQCILENKINIKDNILIAKKTKTNVNIYIDSYKNFHELLYSDDQKRNWEVIEFSSKLPVGMFLGNILKIKEIILINILTLSGFNIWISINSISI